MAFGNQLLGERWEERVMENGPWEEGLEVGMGWWVRGKTVVGCGRKGMGWRWMWVVKRREATGFKLVIINVHFSMLVFLHCMQIHLSSNLPYSIKSFNNLF